MKFTKMHGLGNDYIYINCLAEETPTADRSALAKKLSPRRFSIGSDGLICIGPSDIADFSMDMYNLDGSKSQMCGNGIRCVGKYVYDKGLTDKTTLTVESGGDVKTLDLNLEHGKVKTVRVNMGKPILNPAEIPIDVGGDHFINRPIEVLGQAYHITCVSMGNPHAVCFVEDLNHIDIPKIGPAFETHPLFPERVNTEFIQVLNPRALKMRVWERGSGETLACGTGAAASLVAAVLNGLCEPQATVHLLGGDLEIHWDRVKTGCVFMTGPAVTVFEGEYVLPGETP